MVKQFVGKVLSLEVKHISADMVEILITIAAENYLKNFTAKVFLTN